MNTEESTFQFLDSIPKIRVVVRKRPLTKRELAKSEQDIIDIRGTQSVVVREAKQKVDLTKYIEEHLFNFDRAFDENTTNHHLYLEAVRPLVDALFSKAKCTCFAYGQTGSGKTFTMMGNTAGDNKENQNPIPGLYLLASQDIFALLDQEQFQHLGVFISFYEIYCGKLHDLLNERQEVFAREDAKKNVNIVGLSEKRVMNVHSLMQIIDFGNSVRTTGSTSANQDSSRSHAILQVTLKESNKVFGKMSFIDLAGSERGADVADTKKQTKMDGAEINKSLLALKECIRALDQDKKHTPFRGSKLTLVLKDSFTGNCKTVMIGNISPSSGSCEHTLNTLRYADRVKELKKPQDNSAPLSQADLLAQQLMLPRLQKNATKIALKEDDDDDNQTVGTTNNKNNGGMFNLNNTNGNKLKPNNSPFEIPNFGATNNVSNIFQAQQNQMMQMGLNNPMNSQNSFFNHGSNGYNGNFNPQTNGAFNNNFFASEQQQFPNNPNPHLMSLPQNSGHPGTLYNSQQPLSLISNSQGYSTNENNFFGKNLQNQAPQFKQPMQQMQMPKPVQRLHRNSGLSANNSAKMMLENPIGLNKNPSSKDLNLSRDSDSRQNASLKDSNWIKESPSSSLNNQSGFLSFPTPNNQSLLNANETPIPTKKFNVSSSNQDEVIKSNISDSLSNIQVKAEGDTDLNYLNQKHEEIINLILVEEEEVITSHRRNIDEIVEVTRQEMLILNEVEKPASDIDDYVANLENMINYKIDIMNALKAKLLRLKGHLKEEENISKKFYELRNGDMDIYDTNQVNNLISLLRNNRNQMKTATLLKTDKMPKKSLKKRGKNDLSENLYNPTTGILNSQAYVVFCNDLQQSESLDEQIRLINILNKTSPDLLNKFTLSKGINAIVAFLAKASSRPFDNSELIDKILNFFNKISITSDILKKTKVHMLLEKMKKSLEMPEEICSKCFRLLTKWKKHLEEMKESPQKTKNQKNESKSPSKHSTMETAEDQDLEEEEEDEDFGFKDTPTPERTRERPRIRNDRGGFRNDIKRNPRQNRDYNRQDSNYFRRDGSNSRSNSRYRNNRRDLSQGRYRRRVPGSFSPEEGARKSVQWEDDTKLCSFKFFKFNDEPSAPGLSEEEVIRIRQKLMGEAYGRYIFHDPEEYKHKESLMEGESKKDTEKEIQEKLDSMQPKMYWTSLRKIKIEKEGIQRAQFVGKDSKEKEVQDQRIAGKLPCYYSKEYQIPEQPSNYVEKTTSISEHEPINIPLHTVNDRQEEALEIAEMIEEIILQQEPEQEVSQSQSTSENNDNENEKMEVEIKEESNEKPVAPKPLKGILKKNKDQLREERRAEKAKLDEMLKSVINGEKSLQTETELLEAINNSKHSKNTLENIKILLDMIKNKGQQHDNAEPGSPLLKYYGPKSPERRTRESSNTSTPQRQKVYFGSQPSKRIKLNPELSDSRKGGDKYSIKPESKYRLTTSTEESIGEMQNKVHHKKTEKPANYKTVPCRLFHSPIGCQFGDECHYIHDQNYAGRETPNMHKYVRPLHALSRNPESNLKHIIELDKAQTDKVEMEVENVFVDPKPEQKRPISNTYRRLEPAGSYKDSLSQPKPRPQSISFDAKPLQQQLPAYPKLNSSRLDNQQSLARNPYKSSFINYQETSFLDTNNRRNESTATRHFIRDNSPLRSRSSLMSQYQQKDYSSLKKPVYDVETDTYYSAIRIPPNPFIEGSRSTEVLTPPRQSFMNNQFNNGSTEVSAFSRKFQSPKSDAYPSYAKLSPISTRGGVFVHNNRSIF